MKKTVKKITKKITVPRAMQVAEIVNGKLVPASRPVPKAATGEVLMRVMAAGVNRPDVLQRKGHYPAPKGASDIPGLEVSGIIVAVGKGVTGFKAGQSVCALVAGGGYAEYCVVPAVQCLPVPKGFDFVAAAGLPETHFTVWTNLFDRGLLKKGEALLVHGGSSGIGTTAIQVAKSFGVKVFVTAGSPEKCAACEDLGATAFDYKRQDFVEEIMAATKGRGVDVVLDMVGGDYVPRNIACLAPCGRHVSIATQKGRTAEVDLVQLMTRRLVMTGSTLRPQAVAVKGAIAKALKKNVWPLLEKKKITVVIDRIFPLAEAQAAHDHLEDGQHVGKVILAVARP
ncbi:MAG: NAD(P)H-quinone oxidoreductase [Micavibrio sp.]|nr:NAD(P)H-quinone oxidoreductase [Micavibrio sp.]